MRVAPSGQKNQLIVFARRTRLIIRSSAMIIALLFGWLRFRGVDVLPVVRSLPATILLRGSLVLYYFSWLLGATFDTDTQELVYRTPPRKKGEIPTSAVVTMLVLAVVFAVLCAITSFRQFLMFLALFWLLDHLAWRYLATKLLPPVFRASAAQYGEEKDAARIDQLAFVKVYHTGRWKWRRLITGVVMLLILNIMANTAVMEQLASRIQVSADTILAAGVALYLLLVEGWAWIMRLQTRVAIQTIERLRPHYRAWTGA
jgi:hypothetical protein